jgi:predicted DNA-binding antitoxin AbrB/MazE fold protein
MTIQADAIYEGGLLRPLVPLNLKEHEIVSLSISPVGQNSAADEAQRQRDVLLPYVAKVEARPDAVSQDCSSNRDHDRLIYGN